MVGLEFSQDILQKKASSKRISLIVGNRIPREFFITTGAGESDITIHAGSYDKAVRDAGIENYNIISYTSILPKDVGLVERPAKMVHGSVLEAITAVSNAKKGDRATAGLIFGWVHNKQTGENLGGLVAEYNEHADEQTAKKILKASMDEMMETRYGENKNYELRDVSIIMRTIVPRKNYGTAIVALCFANHLFPVVGYEYSSNGDNVVKKSY